MLLGAAPGQRAVIAGARLHLNVVSAAVAGRPAPATWLVDRFYGGACPVGTGIERCRPPCRRPILL